MSNPKRSERDSGGAGVLGDNVVADICVGASGVGNEATDAGLGGGALKFGDGDGYDADGGVSRGIPAPMGTTFSLRTLLCMMAGVDARELGVSGARSTARAGVRNGAPAAVTVAGTSTLKKD